MMDWAKFVEEERQKQAKSMADVQGLFDQAGISLADIPEIDLNAIEPEIRQQILMQFGFKIEDIIPNKPKTASAWRQRTKALVV